MAISTIDATSTGSTGTVMVSGNMPAFSAYITSTQSISTGVSTKIQLNAERFDTANCFDSTTNYRFTPTVAGYYQISGNVGFPITANNTGIYASIYKNGSAYAVTTSTATATTYCIAGVSALIYFNGTTDYIELYTQQQSASSANVLGSVYATGDATFLCGTLVRAA
jgi:hypothetical protein